MVFSAAEAGQAVESHGKKVRNKFIRPFSYACLSCSLFVMALVFEPLYPLKSGFMPLYLKLGLFPRR